MSRNAPFLCTASAKAFKFRRSSQRWLRSCRRNPHRESIISNISLNTIQSCCTGLANLGISEYLHGYAYLLNRIHDASPESAKLLLYSLYIISSGSCSASLNFFLSFLVNRNSDRQCSSDTSWRLTSMNNQ